MLKLISLFFIMTLATANASCPQANLPYQFLLDQKVIAFTETFTIKSERQKFGEVRRKFFAFTPSFIYTNEHGDVVAEARQKMFSWGVQIDVFDCEKNKLGTIKENVLFSLVFGAQKNFSIYSVTDEKGKDIAKSEKFEWFTTDFILTDKKGHLVSKITRPMINFFGDNWEIVNNSPETLDNRILVMIGAYKTYADNERAKTEAASRRNQNN